jgi:uncharacterized protein (DUF2126 family)
MSGTPDMVVPGKEATAMDGPFETFCNELDALIQRWRDKPEDDKLSSGQVVGALQFAAHNIMQDAREQSLGAER